MGITVKTGTVLATALMTGTAVLSGPVATPAAGAVTRGSSDVTDRPASTTCPATVLLVSRGSEENDRQTTGAVASHSNGWEGESAHRFLDYTLATHPDLLSDGTTDVTGLDPAHYPARLPLPGPGEDITVPALADGAVKTVDSMVRGVPGGLQQVTAWEDATGCRPDYVTLGYSQGVVPLLAVQRYLADQGRLRGVMAFGNPFHRVPGAVPGFPGVAAGTPSLDYCVPDDVVCDTGVRSAYLALTDPDDAGVHADYFKDAVAGNPSTGDRRAADTLAAWLSR